jgi:hypothetical protein
VRHLNRLADRELVLGEFRQLGNIRRDPPRLVLAEQFGSCATSYEGGVTLHRRVCPNSRSGV